MYQHKNVLLRVWAGIVLSVVSMFVFAAEPVAMITDLKGGAHLSGTAAPLSMLTYLPVGEEIVLEDGAHLVVTYFDESAEFAFTGPASIKILQKLAKVEKGAPANKRKLDSEKSKGAASFARTGKLSFATVEMRAMVVKPTLLSPFNSKISTAAPLFSWKSVNDAESYVLELGEEGGDALRTVSVTGNTWQFPVEEALKPGVKYEWHVVETLKSGDKVSAKGSFSVADAEMIARIKSKNPGDKASFSDKVVYAIYLESEGFRNDAKVLWRELAALRPEDRNLKFRAK